MICNFDCFNCVYDDCINDRCSYSQEYYDKNRDKIIVHQREYRKKNRDKSSAYQREYRQKNKDKILDYQREYYAKIETILKIIIKSIIKRIELKF